MSVARPSTSAGGFFGSGDVDEFARTREVEARRERMQAAKAARDARNAPPVAVLALAQEAVVPPLATYLLEHGYDPADLSIGFIVETVVRAELSDLDEADRIVVGDDGTPRYIYRNGVVDMDWAPGWSRGGHWSLKLPMDTRLGLLANCRDRLFEVLRAKTADPDDFGYVPVP